MTSYNDITGDALTSKSNTEKFRTNYDKIFGKPKVTEPEETEEEPKED